MQFHATVSPENTRFTQRHVAARGQVRCPTMRRRGSGTRAISAPASAIAPGTRDRSQIDAKAEQSRPLVRGSEPCSGLALRGGSRGRCAGNCSSTALPRAPTRQCPRFTASGIR